MVDNKRLTIKNIDKIFGRQLYSKWIPGTYGWAVQSVEKEEYSYIFQLASNGPIKQIEVKLRRDPIKYDPDKRQFLYELWSWSHVNSNWEQSYYSLKDLDTMEGMTIRLGLMLEKILPKT